MDLFVKNTVPSASFEKLSSEVQLPEDPNLWPQEILQELYKQAPYVADFEPHIQMDKVDAEKGVGFGHIDISTKTEAPMGSDPSQLANMGVKTVKIPIIIAQRMMQPLDTLVTQDNKMIPLTESRLRRVIFRPQAFDVTSKTPGDISMIGQLYPPYRQNYGFGGGGAVVSAGMGKTGSALSAVISGGLLASDIRSFDRGLGTEPWAKYAFDRSPIFRSAVEKIAGYRPKTTSTSGVKTASVVQVSSTGDNFTVKRAHHKAWSPEVVEMDRGAAARIFGDKVVLAADMSGTVTMADSPEISTDSEEDWEQVLDFGSYRVETEDGRSLLGYCFGSLTDLDGTSLPILLFSNGSEFAVQSDIVGVKVSETVPLEAKAPSGQGVFYRIQQNGKADAMVPMTILGTTPEGYIVKTYDGQPGTIKVQPNVRHVVSIEGVTLLPENFRWLPISGQQISLKETAESLAPKEASAVVELRCFGNDSFDLRGLPLYKVAQDLSSLDRDGVMFYLGGLGVDPNVAIEKMAESTLGRVVQVKVARALDPLGDVKGTFETDPLLEVLQQLRPEHLLKEAAAIPDPQAVDTVLSLGFLNPDNIMEFLAAMPVVEESQQKMCELLLASRLGLKDIPQGALERAIKSTEDVLEGLKVLAFQHN